MTTDDYYCLCGRGACAHGEVELLRAALTRAHEQLGKFGFKGPKQVGRAIVTIEGVMPELQRDPDEDRS